MDKNPNFNGDAVLAVVEVSDTTDRTDGPQIRLNFLSVIF
jgi:hypothetical protein